MSVSSLNRQVSIVHSLLFELQQDNTSLPVEIQSQLAKDLERIASQLQGQLNAAPVRSDLHEDSISALPNKSALEQDNPLKTQVSTWKWDVVNHTIQWSAELNEILGVDPQAKIDDPHFLYNYIIPEDQEKTRAILETALEEGRPFYAEFRIKSVDNDFIWLSIIGTFEQDAYGRPIRAVGISHNITDRKQMEEKLRQSEARLKLWKDQLSLWGKAIDSFFWVLEPDGSYRQPGPIDPFFCGKSFTETQGWKWMDVVHPDDRENLRTQWRQGIQQQQPFTFESRIWHAESGQYRWFIHRIVPMIEDGVLTAWIGASNNIQARKEIVEALERSEASERARAAELRATMDAIPASILLIHDPEGRQISGNRWAYDMFHAPPGTNLAEALYGGTISPIVTVIHDGKDLRLDEIPLRVALRTGKPVEDFELTLVFHDGREIVLLGSVIPLVEDEHVTGAVSVFVDITRRKQIEQALAKSARQLEDSNRELEQFAFIASHDLQEPLRKVKAFGTMIEKDLQGKSDQSTLEKFGRMLNSIDRMQNLVEDLLQLSRVNTKGRPFIAVDLSQVAADVLSDLEGQIRRLKGQVKVGLLPVIQGDPIQMREMLQNLVGNALKFHKPGIDPNVKISGEIIRDHKNTGQKVLIRVEDNGIGFDENTFDYILQPFARLHSRSEYEGTGIGLAIIKKIIDRHHGSLSAHSTPGQGSIFLITLPISQSDPNP